MQLRRILPAAAALVAVAACRPSVPERQNPTAVSYAVFDPTTSEIPLPNALALSPDGLASLPAGAQKELLQAFALTGGFPDDQELPATLDFVVANIAANGTVTSLPPDLDLTTLTPTTRLVLESCPGGAAPVAVEASYAKGTVKGTLTLRRTPDATTGLRYWKSGCTVIIALRGGPSGLHTTQGDPIYPQATTYLITQGKDLTVQENQGLLPGATADERAAVGRQLEQLRQALLPPAVQGAIASAFPVNEAAVIQIFSVTNSGTHPVIDAAAGVVPLPSDLLLDPTSPRPKVANIPAFGPAAAGLATLDGFSTTAMSIIQMSAPIRAASVTGSSVLLYDLSNPAAPVLVPDVTAQLLSGGAKKANYLTEPPQVTQAIDLGGTTVRVSPVIALQPAIPVPLPTGGSVLLPPLKEATEYAVVISNSVRDLAGNSIKSGVVGKLLNVQSPLVAGNVSTVQGLPLGEAVILEGIRQRLQPVFAQAAVDGVPRANVALAYTFRTQTITGKGRLADPQAPSGALQLAALPYSGALSPGSPACTGLGLALGLPQPQAVALDCRIALPGSVAVADTPAAIAAVFDRYGVDASLSRANIGTVIEASIATINLLDDATGAFNPAGGRPEVIKVLLAAPSAANPATQTCAGPFAALAPAKCVPLAIFNHGLGQGRSNLLMLADELNAKGIVVAAIDIPKHGDRSWCRSDAECLTPAHCVAEPALANQGDAPGPTPGFCRLGLTPADPLGSFLNRPSLCLSPTGTCGFTTANAGLPVASSNFFIGANFFRVRDTMRQTVIDISQLVQTLAVVPAAPPTGNGVFDALIGHGIVIVPANIGLVGQSLGSITGAMNVAANPRFDRAVFNVPGGTAVDVFTNAPSFEAAVDALLLSIGVDRSQVATNPAMAAKYLQTLHLLKWILDPADPLNFAGHLSSSTLPNLLAPGGVPGKVDGTQLDKAALVQLATCDQTVPTPFGSLFAADAGLAGIDLVPGSPTSARFQWYVNPVSGSTFAADPSNPVYPTGCAAGVSHGFVASWGFRPGAAANAEEAALTNLAQAFAGGFLLSPSDVASIVTPATPVP